MSSLKVNYAKRMLCGVNIIGCNIIGCKNGKLPMRHLGLPLGANPNRIQTWQPVIDAIQKKFRPWKKKHISIGGRLTLVKSTMSNIPIYYMSIFKIPITMANRIERLQREFLWGYSEEKEETTFGGMGESDRE